MTSRQKRAVYRFLRRQFPVLVAQGAKIAQRHGGTVLFYVRSQQTGCAKGMKLEHALGRTLTDDEKFIWQKTGRLAC